MTDRPDIPEELIEEVAKAMYEADRSDVHEPWDGGKGIMLSDEPRDAYRRDARNALQAAAPALRKQGAEEAQKALEECEDRFESCDNCERPSREEDLKVIWCRDAESGEQVDARICLVCRLETERDQALAKGAEEERERLLGDDMRRAIGDIAADNADAEDIARLVLKLIAKKLDAPAPSELEERR